MKFLDVDGVKVFEPTLDEFQDFGGCIKEIERHDAANAGLAKVNFLFVLSHLRIALHV